MKIGFVNLIPLPSMRQGILENGHQLVLSPLLLLNIQRYI